MCKTHAWPWINVCRRFAVTLVSDASFAYSTMVNYNCCTRVGHMRIRQISSFLLGVVVLTIFAQSPVRAQMLKGDPAEEFGVRIGRLKYGGGGDWYNNPSSIPTSSEAPPDGEQIA